MIFGTIKQLLFTVLLSAYLSRALKQGQAFNEQFKTQHKYQPINFTSLNQKLETLNSKFLQQFSKTFTIERVKNFNDEEAGHYLFMLGKMYIYNLLPTHLKSETRDNLQNQQKQQQLSYFSKSRYLLGYYYLQMAAQVYENGDAYYYLAVLQYMKLTPTILIKNNIKKLVNLLKKPNSRPESEGLQRILRQWQSQQLFQHDEAVESLEQIAYDMETHHLHFTEHNLYLASILGQIPAKLTLAYLLKQGISTDRNCSAAISYYLSVIKQTKIENFEYPADYVDRQSFQKQLYSRKKVDLQKYGDYDPTVLLHTAMYGEDEIAALEDIAMKYMTGQDGFPINQPLSIKMLEKIQTKSKLARLMLGFMYLKGRGTNKDYKRAKYLFEADEWTSKVAKQTLIVMKFYGLAFQGKTKLALDEMKQLYLQFERKMNKTTLKQQQKAMKAQQAAKKATENNQKEKDSENEEIQQSQQETGSGQKQTPTSLREKKQAIRTPMMKYLIGSLVLSQDIKGNKGYAINLIDEAAKEGNTLALTLLGLSFIDGSDSSYDCERSANYFSRQALSHVVFQQRIQLAKIGIKKGLYMFSFIKYVQLMMVGYKNAFINSLYLTEVYKAQLFQFNEFSWSIQQAQRNDVYKLLVKQQIIERMNYQMLQQLGLSSQNLFTEKTIEYLTTTSSSNSSLAELSEYKLYINSKITEIGILKHQISILKFYKYKQTKDIKILHWLADLGENSPHVFEARFLLGKYYHHTNISGSQQKARIRRAIQEYNRATKNSLLGKIIYIIEGGEFEEGDQILEHLTWYLIIIFAVWIFLYWKKNKRMEEIYQLERKKQEEENRISLAQKLPTQDQSAQEGREMIKEESQLKKNQFLFMKNATEEQYKGPKFSEEEAQNMINRRNLMNIGFMMDEKMKRISSSQKAKEEQNSKTQDQQIKVMIDRDQPIVEDDEETQKLHNN